MLSKTKTILMLQPFSLQPRSTKEASKILNVSLSNYNYWIKRFLDVGLLSLAYEKKRAGSNVKYYWMAADKLIVNLHDNPKLIENHYLTLLEIYNNITLEGLITIIKDLDLKLEINIIPTDNEYLFYRLVHNDGFKRTSLKHEFLKTESPAVLAVWRHLQLSFQDAKSLQKELSELVGKYQAKSKLGQNSYYYQSILVPETN